jgi:hypothetical protein
MKDIQQQLSHKLNVLEETLQKQQTTDRNFFHLLTDENKEKFSFLETQFSSLIETINVFNETFSNIEKKIENLEDTLEGRIENVLEEKKLQDEIMAFDRGNAEEEEVKAERKPTKANAKKRSGGMKSEVNRNPKPTGKKTAEPPRKATQKRQYDDNDDEEEEDEENEDEHNFDDETESDDDDDHDHDDYHSRSRRPPSGSSYGKEVHRYDYHEEEPNELQRGQTGRRTKDSPKDLTRTSRRSKDYQEMNDDDDDEDIPPLKNKKVVVPKKKYAGDDLPDLKKGRPHDKDDDDQDSEEEDMGGNHHHYNRPVATRQQQQQQQGKPVRRNDPSSSRGQQQQHQQHHHHSGGKTKQYDHRYDPSTYHRSDHSEQTYQKPHPDETTSNHHRNNQQQQQQQNHKMPYQYKQQVFSREFNDSSVSSLHSASRQQKHKESKNSPTTDHKTSSQVNSSKVGIAAESSSIHNDHQDQSNNHDHDNLKVSSSPVSSESITISEFEEEEGGGEGEDEESAHKPHRLDPEPPPAVTYQRLKDEEKEIEDDMDRIDEYIQLLNSKSADMETNNPYLKQYISEQERLQQQNDEEETEEESSRNRIPSHEKGIIKALAEDFDEEGEELNDDEDHYNEILSDESSYHQHAAQQFEKMIHDHPAHKSLARSYEEKTNPINDYYSINSQKIVDYSFLNNSRDSTYELPFHSHFVSVPPHSQSPPAASTTTIHGIATEKDYDEKEEVEEPIVTTAGEGFAKFHNLIDKIQSDIHALDLHLIKNQQFDEQYYHHHPSNGGNMTKVNQTDENQQKKGEEEDLVLNLSHLRKEEDTEIPIKSKLPIVQEVKTESTKKEEKRRPKPEKLISLDKLPTLPEKVPSLSPTSSSLSTKAEEECFDSDDEEINNANNARQHLKEEADSHDSDSSSVPSPVMMMKGSRGGKKSSAAVADALNLKKKQKKEELEKTNTKVSLNDLAHLSMNDLNESLEYYDNEEPELPGITVNPRKEVSMPSKPISNSQSVTHRTTTTSSNSSSDVAKENENLGDSDDDSASDIDSLDEIYFHSNKDLNEMKQTASLAQQEEGVLMGGRTPLASNDEGDDNRDLDLLLEFDYLLNRSSGRKSKSPSHQQGSQRSPSPSNFHVPPAFSLSYHNLKESLPTNDKGNFSHEPEVSHHLKPLRPIDKNVQKKNKFDLDDFLFDQSRQSIHFPQSLQRGGSGSGHSLKDQTTHQKNHRKEEEESLMLDNDFTNREKEDDEDDEEEEEVELGDKKKNSASTSSLQRSSQRQQKPKPTPSSISSVERSAFLIDDSYENELNELQDYLHSEKEFPSHLYAKNPVLQEEHQKKIQSLQEKKRNHRKKFLASLQDS